ncbi:hypothetical protein GCM10010433_61980 [Streptomyces pulveraceus]
MGGAEGAHGPRSACPGHTVHDPTVVGTHLVASGPADQDVGRVEGMGGSQVGVLSRKL